MKKFIQEFNSSDSLSELFQLVKSGVKEIMGRERAGLMLGMADLGMKAGGFVGAFYPVGSNIIVVNTTPLKVLEGDRPELVKPYMFHLLLHEYLHSIGILDENLTEGVTREVSKRMFGEEHIVAKMATNFVKYFPKITMPQTEWQPESEFKIELIEGFDDSGISYIG
jgi:hypothetical protein